MGLGYIVLCRSSLYTLLHARFFPLGIIRQPMIEPGSCAIEPLKNKRSTEFTCRVTNYSEYTEVVVVENNQTLFNKSTNEVSFGCWPNVPDPSIATCTVNVSTSLYSGKLHYKLCVGYNSSVPHKTKLQCSHDIIVSSIESYGKGIWMYMYVYTEV